MNFHMRKCIIYNFLFNSIAFSASLSNNKADTQNSKADIEEVEVQTLVNCKSWEKYANLSQLTFNPRDIPMEHTTCLALRMFTDMGFLQHFSLPVDAFSRFILRVQKGYHNEVSYHNWFHGFAVLHFCFSVLKNCQLIEKQHLKHLEGLALMVSAMCHDLDHPGSNNQFQAKLNTSLAQKYGEQGSILEKLIYTEFFTQGDNEKRLGLVPHIMMDRSQAKIPQIQVNFISQVIIPEFQVLLSLYPELQIYMANIQRNVAYWQEAVPYFEDQLSQGRNQIEILSDKILDDYVSRLPTD